MGQIILPEGASPATPLTGNVAIYAKTDSVLYMKDDAGTETALADPNTLKANVTDTLTVGYTTTSYSDGTVSTGTLTPNPDLGNMHHYTNGGAHTLAPPASSCSMIIEITNNASAGAITTSGFTKVTGTFTTTNGHKFICNVVKSQGNSLLQIQALQ